MMKKTFALLLAACLLLCAPAALAQWEKSSATTEFYSVRVKKCVLSTADGGSEYFSYDENAKAINHSPIYFQIELVIPENLPAKTENPANVLCSLTTDGAAFPNTFRDAKLQDKMYYGLGAQGYVTSGTYYWDATARSCSDVGDVRTGAFVPSSISKISPFFVSVAECTDTDTSTVTCNVASKGKFSESGNTLTYSGYTVEYVSSITVYVYKQGANMPYMRFARGSSTGKVGTVRYFKTGANYATVTRDTSEPLGFRFTSVTGGDMTSADEEFVRDTLARLGFTMQDVKDGVYMTDDNIISEFGGSFGVTGQGVWAASAKPIVKD